MYGIIKEIFSQEKFWIKHVDLLVGTGFHSITLRGLIQFRDHTTYEGKDNRFKGLESNAFKQALKEIVKDTAIVQVSVEPKGRGNAPGAYEFLLTKNYQSKEQLAKDIKEMDENGLLLEHVYSVNTHALEKNQRHC